MAWLMRPGPGRGGSVSHPFAFGRQRQKVFETVRNGGGEQSRFGQIRIGHGTPLAVIEDQPIFPCVVQGAAAENIEIVVQDGRCRIPSRRGQWRLARPSVGDRVEYLHQVGPVLLLVFPVGAARDQQLAVHGARHVSRNRARQFCHFLPDQVLTAGDASERNQCNPVEADFQHPSAFLTPGSSAELRPACRRNL
jgi:hypothetical protein